MREPIPHSHITDCLDDDHPLRNDTIYCGDCCVMVHAYNNECMQSWWETGLGVKCWLCLMRHLADCPDAEADGTVLCDHLGLPA